MAETTPPSAGSNYYLRPLNENVNRLAYENNFINIAAAEPSLGVPSDFSYYNNSTTYYFPVIAVADNYGDSRKFTNKCNDFVYFNGNIGVGTATPSEKLTILGGLSASNKLTIGLAHVNGTYYSSILGGAGNTVSGEYSSIVGGTGNTVLSAYSYIGGGFLNIVQSPNSIIVGGTQNYICGIASNINGGAHNIIEAAVSNINGGDYNTITVNADCSVISGGLNNTVSGYLSNINGGQNNLIGSNANHSTISSGYYNAIESCFSSIGGGSCNYTSGVYTSINGGYKNEILESNGSAIVNGSCNLITGFDNVNNFIGNGICNQILDSDQSFIGTGVKNKIDGSSISGIVYGNCNLACNVRCSFIGAGSNNTMCESFASSLVGGYYNRIYGPSYNFIGGGYLNNICGINAGITHGICNKIGGYMASFGSTILGGCLNVIDSNVVGGYLESAYYFCNNIIAGGEENVIVNSNCSSVLGGSCNNIRFSNRSSILGGNNNFLLSSTNTFILASNTSVTSINDTTFVENLSVLRSITSPTRFTENVTMQKNLVVFGTISALSGIVSVATTVAETSTLKIENYGIGPALTVFQDLNYPISHFKTNQNTFAFYIGNTPANPIDGNLANIGINTNTPNEELTVNGSISSNSVLYVSGGNSEIWNKSSLKAITSIGDNINTSYIIYHNFNSTDILTQVVDNLTSSVVYPLITYTSLSTVRISFANLPSSSQYKVILRN
jgi:hypothetical protein